MANVSQQTNIDKYVVKLNNFNYNSNTNNTLITQAIEMQTKKIEEIKNIKTNIDQSTFDENIKKQYIKYLDYIINIIEAKILKDKAIMNLLNIAFNQINTVLGIINKSKNKFEKIRSIEELIEIPNAPQNDNGVAVDYDFPVNDELKRILKINENNITIETLKKKINEMINRCVTDVEKNIKKFVGDLNNIGKNTSVRVIDGGTNGTYIPGFDSFNSNERKNKYKRNLISKKNAYEKSLKENIKAYEKICDLLSGENGLLPNIIASLKTIYEDSKKINSGKITKKWGLNLDVLLNDEPFKENIDIFTKMVQQIIAAKNELLNTSVQQNPQGTQAIVQAIVPSSIPSSPRTRPTRVQAIVPTNEIEIDIKSDFGETSSQESVNIDHDIVQAYIEVFANEGTIIDNGKIKTLAVAQHNGARKKLDALKNKASYEPTKAFLNHIYKEMQRILIKQGKTMGNKELEKQLKELIVPKTKGGRRKKKSSKKSKKSKKQSGGFIRGGVLFPESFYISDIVM